MMSGTDGPHLLSVLAQVGLWNCNAPGGQSSSLGIPREGQLLPMSVMGDQGPAPQRSFVTAESPAVC